MEMQWPGDKKHSTYSVILKVKDDLILYFGCVQCWVKSEPCSCYGSIAQLIYTPALISSFSCSFSMLLMVSLLSGAFYFHITHLSNFAFVFKARILARKKDSLYQYPELPPPPWFPSVISVLPRILRSLISWGWLNTGWERVSRFSL